jgi:hypothetical protein
VSMNAADDFEIIRIRMKAIARDEGKPWIEVSGAAGNLTQPGCPPHDIELTGKCARCGITPPPRVYDDYCD